MLRKLSFYKKGSEWLQSVGVRASPAIYAARLNLLFLRRAANFKYGIGFQ